MRGLGLLVLRFANGSLFVAHGLPKLIPIWGTGPDQAAAQLEAAGVASAYPVTVATGIVEVLAGTLLIAGAYTAWVSVLLAVTTAATLWIVRTPDGLLGHPAELEFLQVSGLVCLMLAGPGVLSYDARRTRERELRKAQRAEAKGKRR